MPLAKAYGVGRGPHSAWTFVCPFLLVPQYHLRDSFDFCSMFLRLFFDLCSTFVREKQLNPERTSKKSRSNPEETPKESRRIPEECIELPGGSCGPASAYESWKPLHKRLIFTMLAFNLGNFEYMRKLIMCSGQAGRTVVIVFTFKSSFYGKNYRRWINKFQR